MKEMVKKYLNLKAKMNKLNNEIKDAQDNIITEMKKKKISATVVDAHEISYLGYSKYTNWNNKKLREHLGNDYDIYVTKITRIKVNIKELQESSEWETVKRFAKETNVSCLRVKEVK